MKLSVLLAGLVLQFNGALAQAAKLEPPADLGPVRELTGNQYYNFYAIDSQGRLRVWGMFPHEIPADLGKVKTVVSNFNVHCAILEGSELRCWEEARTGGDITEFKIPKVVEKVKSIAVDEGMFCAQSLDGTGYCWMPDWWVDKGIYQLPSTFDFPARLAVYGEGLCALVSDGKITCKNVWKEVGGYAAISFINPPTGSFRDLSTVSNTGLAIRADRSVVGMGREYDRGDGVIPADLGPVRALSQAYLNACAIQDKGTSSGPLKCWDLYGDGYYHGNATPITDEVIGLAVGYKSGCGVLPDHTVKCWSEW